MAEFEISQKLHQPRKTVWSFFSQFHNRSQWIPGVSDSKLLTPGPLAVGSRYSQTRTVDGRTETNEFEITEYEPERKWSAVARPRGCVLTYQYIFEGDGPQTVVNLKITLEPVGFLGKVFLPMGLKTARSCDSSQLSGLKSAIGG